MSPPGRMNSFNHAEDTTDRTVCGVARRATNICTCARKWQDNKYITGLAHVIQRGES